MVDEDIDPTRSVADGEDALVTELRRLAAEADPVPENVVAAAHAAIGTRDLDRELAELVADSAAVEDPATAFEPVRNGATGSQYRRLLSFAHDDVQVDLEVSDHGDRIDLIGQFTGASTQDCALEYADGANRALDVDGLGRFLVSGVRRGALRARFSTIAGAPMTTAWVTI
jgi:hypothetical protein